MRKVDYDPAHPQGTGLNPNDYMGLEPSFYQNPEVKLKVQKPATAWNLPGAVNFAQAGTGTAVPGGSGAADNNIPQEIPNTLNPIQSPRNATSPALQTKQNQKSKVGPTSSIWDKFQRAYDIGNEVLNDPKFRGHNDAGDAMCHAEWMRRVTKEVGPGTAKAMGILNEIKGIFEHQQPIPELIMDLHNNQEGINSATDDKPINPNNLQLKP